VNDWGSQLKRKLEAEGKLPAPKKRAPRGTLAERVADEHLRRNDRRGVIDRVEDDNWPRPLEFFAVVAVAPRTKKNHGRRLRRGKYTFNLPSEAFEAFEEAFLEKFTMPEGAHMIDFPVNARVIFFRDALRGDAVGYYQAIADVLQKARVVEDDKWIVSWDGSRLELDRKNPRLEIVLERVQP
jgi:Holliday junction resolvase RusA-like endonuclease